MLAERVPELFRELESEGFPLQGLVDIDRVDPAAWSEHVARYDDWLARGHQGEMQYLVRGRDRRADPRVVFPAARSVLVVAFPYPAKPAGSPEGARYAAYLRGRDYHDVIAERMEAALARFRAGGEDLTWKVCVDTSAVLERSWAQLAGLGWIGKNKMLLNPRLGSYFFLGVALLSRESGRAPSPHANLCGHCTRCLDGCPTRAFTPEGFVDSRRCISYLTLEKRGPWNADPGVVGKMGPWVAGCDVCQEVCPFNLKRLKAESGVEVDDGPTALASWEALANESEERYRARVKGTALSRIKPPDFRRNVDRARLAGTSLEKSEAKDLDRDAVRVRKP